MVTVKQLLAGLVPVPLKLAFSVVDMVPVEVKVTKTVTTCICRPGRLFREQVTVAPFRLPLQASGKAA